VHRGRAARTHRAVGEHRADVGVARHQPGVHARRAPHLRRGLGFAEGGVVPGRVERAAVRARRREGRGRGCGRHGGSPLSSGGQDNFHHGENRGSRGTAAPLATRMA
jgi:hypothetical protein